MAQIGQYEWQMNMVVIAQVNCTGANTKATCNIMKATRKGSQKYMWQHNMLALVFSLLTDNAIVKTLSNFHTPVIIKDSVQCWCRVDGARQRDQVGVPLPEQEKDYNVTFHMIDKEIGVEAKHNLDGNM